ncbi:MAG: DNA polymerase Y family protein [Hyphomicrobium sp.]
MKRFVSVWLPNWPMTRLARAAPHLVPRDEPFALVDFGTRNVVITAVNASAAREGIAIGTPLCDARAAFPRLRARPGEREEDAQVLIKLARWAGRYGPSRGDDKDGADGFWADITGVAHLYGGEEKLLADLIGRLEAFSIPARAALADTYGAAHALARFAVRSSSSFVIAPVAAHRSALAPLPVEALRLDGDVVVLLKRLGLKRIGDLYDIPRISLAHRFSSDDAAHRVLVRLDQALGETVEPLRPFFDLAPFLVQRSFAEPLISSEALEAIIFALCDELAEVLKEKDMGTRSVFLAFYRADGTAGHIAASLRSASSNAAHFKTLLKEKLGKMEAGFGVDLLSLSATRVSPLKGSQPGFAEEEGDGYDAGPLIDRLSNRLGASAVAVLEPHASHIPERSQRPVAALASSLPPSQGVGERLRRRPISPRYVPPWPYGQGARRPPFLLSRPEPIAVVAEVPDGPPVRFVWRRVERRVARAAGPERIAPEWWRAIGLKEEEKRARARDYYEIEDEAGAAYWVFRHGLYGSDEESDAPPRWYVHGMFA